MAARTLVPLRQSLLHGAIAFSPPPWHSLVERREDRLVAPPRGFFSGQVGWITSHLLPFSSTDTYRLRGRRLFLLPEYDLSEDTQDCLGTIGHSKAMSGGSLGCLCRWAWRSYWTCAAWQGGAIWSLDGVMRGVRVVSVSGRGLAAASFVDAHDHLVRSWVHLRRGWLLGNVRRGF